MTFDSGNIAGSAYDYLQGGRRHERQFDFSVPH